MECSFGVRAGMYQVRFYIDEKKKNQAENDRFFEKDKGDALVYAPSTSQITTCPLSPPAAARNPSGANATLYILPMPHE
jgi:hypothetical protein